MEIKKAIIPAAGLGLRFLPFTKSIPKEMLPLLNKPAIQYIVEEAINSEIKNLFLITSKDKAAIANHFDYCLNLENLLKERSKTKMISSIEKIIRTANFIYIRQEEPLGLGHAIWKARHLISHNEYFGVILPDEIFLSQTPGLSQLIRVARQEKASVVAVQEVPENAFSSYGMVGIKKQITPNLFQISHLVEKPEPNDSPSNLALIGRYVLSSKIFDSLEDLSGYATEELQLTDAISNMIKHKEKVYAYKIQGIRYDIGNPIGWIKALIDMSLRDPNYAPHILEFIKQINTYPYVNQKFDEKKL